MNNPDFRKTIGIIFSQNYIIIQQQVCPENLLAINIKKRDNHE